MTATVEGSGVEARDVEAVENGTVLDVEDDAYESPFWTESSVAVDKSLPKPSLNTWMSIGLGSVNLVRVVWGKVRPDLSLEGCRLPFC